MFIFGFILKPFTKIWYSFLNRILGFIHFKLPTMMNVKISDKGRKVLNDKRLSASLVSAMVNKKNDLQDGRIVRLEGSRLGIKYVTTMKELAKKQSKSK